MSDKTAWQGYSNLPPEAQKQVEDFIAFLQAKYGSARRRRKAVVAISDEEFIGIWRKRADLRDSTAWVRSLRSAEWRDK